MGMSLSQISRNPKNGYYFIILAAITAALIHVLSKPLLESGNEQIQVNPIVMAFLIYFVCGIFFTPLTKRSKSKGALRKKDFAFMGIIAAAEVTGLITYFFGLSTSTAVNASIFSNSEIIFSLIIALVLFKEKLHIKEYIPFTMIIIGMMVIPIGNDLYINNFSMNNLVTGDVLIIISGLIYAVDITLCKYLGDRFDEKKVVQVVSFVSAGISISLIALFQIPMDVDLIQLPTIFFMSIVGTGMSTIFFLIGLRTIGAVRTVLLYSTTSVFGIIFSGLILSEVITPMNIISTIMVLTGIFLLRNRLGEETIESSAQKTKTVPKRKSSRCKLYTCIRKAENEISFQSWIGAG